MKKVYFLLLLLAVATSAFAQEKTIKTDGNGRKWINTLEPGFIITSGRAGELELAKQQAIDNVKQTIVQSVAEHIQVSTTQETTELNGDVNSFLSTYNSEIKTESGDVPFLKGISISKAEGWYWEKVKNKSTKAIFYRFHIRYPFSDQELNALIAAYEKNDRELTDRLNKELSIIDLTNSLDEMLAANNRLREMTGIFKDQRQQKVRAGLAAFKATMQSLSVVPLDNHPGKMIVVLRSGQREFTVSKPPRVSSPCAGIEEVSDIEGGTLITYSYDYCTDGSDQNYLEFYYSIGSVRVKDIVRFNVTAYKVELSISGKIRLELINNLAKLTFSIKAAYSTSFNITRIELELPDNEQLVFEPLEINTEGKGMHNIRAEKALSPASLSLFNKANYKSVSGRIFYTQNDTQISGSYRFYKVGFKLVK